MALIKCPECGKEISDEAKKCIHCGYVLKKNVSDRKKFKFIIIAIIAIVIVLVMCFILQNERKKRELAEQHQQEIIEIDRWVQEVYEGKIPSQQEYNEMMERYKNLEEDDRISINNTDILNELEMVDLDRIIEITNEIEVLDQSSKFIEILDIKEQYDILNEKEKEFIDISNVEALMELSDVENAALAACKNVKSCMKNKEDFKVREVIVKDDLEKMNFYWVLVKYSGTNSFGANLDKTSCFGISSDFKDPFFALAKITGISEYLDSAISYNEYTKSEKPEIPIDVDKIAYYLEKE